VSPESTWAASVRRKCIIVISLDRWPEHPGPSLGAGQTTG
jgi:hypothetical protein